MLFETRIVIITGVIITEELANNNNIEDITWPRGDSNFVFEWHEKKQFVSPSGHVMFCLFYRY